MTSTALFLALQFITTQSYVFDNERVIRQASELVPWCKAKAEYHYMLMGMQTFQWTARHYSRTNELHVDGKIRVHGEDVVVRCRMTSGEREQTATIEIDDP